MSAAVFLATCFNPLKPNDAYSGRTAPLTSKRCILYIYSTNIGTEYFKHGIYSPFFSSSKFSLFHNSSVFRSCIIHILYTRCAKIKKKTNFGAKRLSIVVEVFPRLFSPNIAPSRMFTTNSLCLILCPIHEWRLFFFLNF